MINAEKRDFSIIIPVYFNKESLEKVFAELVNEVINHFPDKSGEIVYVDDGSGDDSLDVLKRLQSQQPELVRVFKLSRNFGQLSAIWCGLTNARGNATIVISADGQDPVSFIREMLDIYFNEEKEIIICARKDRDESLWRKITSGFFYRTMRKLCFPNMPIGGFDLFLLGNKARKALLMNYQQHGFLQGQILRLGFNPCFLDYSRRARSHGSSKWTFAKKITYLLDGVIGYSFFPLRLMSVVGMCVAVIGIIYAILILFMWFIYGNPIQGWTPLMITVLAIGGIQMLMLGVIGEYLWRVKAQVSSELPYIVEEIVGDDQVV